MLRSAYELYVAATERGVSRGASDPSADTDEPAPARYEQIVSELERSHTHENLSNSPPESDEPMETTQQPANSETPDILRNTTSGTKGQTNDKTGPSRRQDPVPKKTSGNEETSWKTKKGFAWMFGKSTSAPNDKVNTDPQVLCGKFKKALSVPDARVHYVAVW